MLIHTSLNLSHAFIKSVLQFCFLIIIRNLTFTRKPCNNCSSPVLAQTHSHGSRTRLCVPQHACKHHPPDVDHQTSAIGLVVQALRSGRDRGNDSVDQVNLFFYSGSRRCVNKQLLKFVGKLLARLLCCISSFLTEIYAVPIRSSNA